MMSEDAVFRRQHTVSALRAPRIWPFLVVCFFVLAVYAAVAGWLYSQDLQSALSVKNQVILNLPKVEGPDPSGVLRPGKSDTFTLPDLKSLDEVAASPVQPDQVNPLEETLTPAREDRSEKPVPIPQPRKERFFSKQGKARITLPLTAVPPLPSSRKTGMAAPVPAPGLVAKGKYGLLPVIAADGRLPWRVYSRPTPSEFRQNGVKRASVIVSGLGISASATRRAIEELPPEVTLAFAPYADRLQNWINLARKAGHEVLLELPMEPYDYPNNDPGPHTLLTTEKPAENLDRLEWLLSRAAGYAGVINYQGALFTSEAEALAPVMDAIGARGLLYVNSGNARRSVVPKMAVEKGLPWVQIHRVLDNTLTRDGIDASLAAMEARLKKEDQVTGIGAGFPLTLSRLQEWIKTLDGKGIKLVPVSATVQD